MAPKFPIAVLDGLIKIVQILLSLFSRSLFSGIICVHTLAVLRLARYKLSQQKEDLDKFILQYTEAVIFSPVFWARLSVNILRFRLALALLNYLNRFQNFKQAKDVQIAIDYLRYLRGLPLESFYVHRNNITINLIKALAAQVESEAGDETQNIDEMVALCRELLAPNIPTKFPFAACISLCDTINAEFIRGRPIQSLDAVIECLRDAVKVCPSGSTDVLFALANILYVRFFETHSNDDYEDATALLERILDPNRPGECRDSIRGLASLLSTQFAFTRSLIFRNPEYSEMAISRLRAELSSPSIDERICFRYTEVLATLSGQRFRDYSLAESLEETNSSILQVVDLSSSQSLEKSGRLFTGLDAVRETYSTTAIHDNIQKLEALLSNTPPMTDDHKRLISGLADWYWTRFLRTEDISDIEQSIKYSRLRLSATHPNDLMRAGSLSSLRNVLLLAFEHTNKINYLDESITLGYDILRLKNAQHIHFQAIQQLVSSLLTRSQLLSRAEEPHEAIRLMSLAIDDQYAREPDRFRLACAWALLARHINHPSALTAYKRAMTSMQMSLSFAPTISIQHTRLVEMGGGGCQSMPLDFASFQIDLGLFKEAVETLEQGRVLLWSEMRGLRNPVAQFLEEDSPLAKRFAEINRELEAMTISITPSGKPEIEDGVARGRDWTDPFGRLVVKQRKLVKERGALISQIQSRPGSEGFLKAPSFAALRSAASRGPVIIINHCKWRSDIVVLFHDSLPCVIPTSTDFYDRANKLRDELVEARKHGLDSAEYKDALCTVLKDLYKLVGEPVIEKLRLLGVPEQSRIWWCPTSVFCSLPLHAMGPMPSCDASNEQYFSDLYIPSYTPSLSALIESRNAKTQIQEKPSLLLVAQPDDSLPGVWGEMKVIRSLEARVTVADLVSSTATPSSVIEGLRSSHFAHFACHGMLETGKPFEASFKLYGSSRLTLLDIVRSRLPDAEFAFLSCCHAAEITEDSIADEALHLTAAMQYCGFRSVVGTMWEMADTDGRDLAKSFYKSLLSSNQDAGVPYYERSARALRDATQKLRKKRGITLERWVNFVHYGA
ncbi:CHAT domain-containing protein [Lactarius deliciosus]|nr:CHAT domain-containing protein [Lactarius deliciosus]